MKIKKGDNVIVIAGASKGKKGKVLEVISSTSRVVLDGINMRKHNIKPKKSGEKGSIVEKPAPMHISNVQILADGKASRVSYKKVNGKNVRIAKKTGAEI